MAKVGQSRFPCEVGVGVATSLHVATAHVLQLPQRRIRQLADHGLEHVRVPAGQIVSVFQGIVGGVNVRETGCAVKGSFGGRGNGRRRCGCGTVVRRDDARGGVVFGVFEEPALLGRTLVGVWRLH